ncbi:MAG: OB-fold domain-containing protein [Actinomycetota bacterium]|nr:OB-fold domain-containing protein [Actinomycetota bacterium]
MNVASITIPESAEAADYPPIPEPDNLTEFFWEGVASHRLLIQHCDACDTYIHYPRPICPKCLSMDHLAPKEVSGRGTIYSHTTTVQPFHPYFVDKVPYNLIIVALEEDENVRLTSNLIDYPNDDIRIGMPVQVTFQELAPGLTLPLFKLA